MMNENERIEFFAEAYRLVNFGATKAERMAELAKMGENAHLVTEAERIANNQ